MDKLARAKQIYEELIVKYDKLTIYEQYYHTEEMELFVQEYLDTYNVQEVNLEYDENGYYTLEDKDYLQVMCIVSYELNALGN